MSVVILEVWCAPSATHVPCIIRSQNKVGDIKSVCYLIFYVSLHS